MTRKKNPARYDDHLDLDDLLRVSEEKDLGAVIKSKLTWKPQVLMITAKTVFFVASPPC